MPTVSAALLAGLLAASGATAVLTIHDPDISESSGLVRSVRHPTMLWTHNDGGSTAEIYGISPRGRTISHLTLSGVDPYDPEALSIGKDDRGRSAIFLGDIGDNGERRPNVSVFRVTEPKLLGDRAVSATWFRFRYADGAHDAEALMVDPRDGRVWVATKSFGPGGLYRAPRNLVEESRGTNVLRRVSDVPPLVTDGAFLPDGKFVLRTYTSAFLYDSPGKLREQLTMPAQKQAESIAVDGDRLLVGSEGRRSPILAVPLPDDVAGGPRATPTDGGTSTPRRSLSSDGLADGIKVMGAGLGLALLASVLVVLAARWRRDR